MATLPAPTGWKPGNKAEILVWLGNLEIQLGSAMNLIEEDSQAKAQLYVALQIIGKIETLAHSA